MKILIISNNSVSSLFGKNLPFEGTECAFAKELSPADLPEADCIIDLSFEQNPQRINRYKSLAVPVLIGSVILTLKELDAEQSTVARFNHWPGFLQRNCIEFATTHPQLFEKLFRQWQVPFYHTADVPGFVSARTISMIVNEAFFTKEENVSSPDEIDIAMKSGTSYPMGPFEWCNEIGAVQIIQLLQKLSTGDNRYQPALSLLKHTENH